MTDAWRGEISGHEPATIAKSRPDAPAFTATSFRVPRQYLDLLVGPEAARQLIKDAGSKVMPDHGEALSSVTFLKLCLERMRATGDESFGVDSKPVPKGTFGVLMAAASQGDTLAEALKRFAAAAMLLRSDVSVKFSRNRDSLSLRLDYVGERDARKELSIETFALTIHCGFRWLTGLPLQPVHLRLAEPIGAFQKTVLKDLLCCPTIIRGRGVTLSYDAADAEALLAPVKYNTWAAHEFGEFMKILEEAAAKRNCRGHHDAPQIIEHVQKTISAGWHNEADVAEQLRISPATLRRRLTGAGTSFRMQLDQVQRETAAVLLMTDKALEDIASEISYSDVRSFRRACQRWFGMTPTAYRNSHKPF